MMKNNKNRKIQMRETCFDERKPTHTQWEEKLRKISSCLIYFTDYNISKDFKNKQS